VLLNDPYDLAGGPPVTALFVQNTNPASVAPDQTKVKQGLAREDLFTCVHEQFMTETAKFADIVLPATMFLEHDDIYQGGGHSHLLLGRKLVEAPGECRNNHEVICDLAKRVGAAHPGFQMSPRELIDWTLTTRTGPGLDRLDAENWIDVQPDFEHGAFPQGLRPYGRQVPLPRQVAQGALQGMELGRWARWTRCRSFPIISNRSRRRRKNTPSGWPPARRGPS
jgi:anaerobic selenocysteine-containing dehydrogenase